MRWTRLQLLLIASSLAGGCDYPVYGFVPDLVDTGGSDATVDEGVDATADSRLFDAGDDTETTTDGADGGDGLLDSVVVDAGTDTTTADVPGDVLVTKGCAGSAHVFCADFDSVLTPQDGWTDVNLVGGGTNLVDHALFVSPSSSYAAAIPASTATEAAASLNEDFTLASASMLLRAEVYMRLDAATSAHETLLLKISRVGTGNGVDVVLGPGGLVMDIVGTASSGTFPLYSPTPGVWFKVKLEVVLATGTTGSAKAYIDDKLIVTQTAVATTTSTSATARLVVGVYQNDTSITAARANFDDVIFDTF